MKHSAGLAGCWITEVSLYGKINGQWCQRILASLGEYWFIEVPDQVLLYLCYESVLCCVHSVAVLKKDKDAVMKRISELEENIEKQMLNLKARVVKAEDIESKYHSLFQQCEAFLKELREREQQQIEEEKEVRVLSSSSGL